MNKIKYNFEKFEHRNRRGRSKKGEQLVIIFKELNKLKNFNITSEQQEAIELFKNIF